MKKKSLIDTLKTTKKANVVTSAAKNEGSATRKAIVKKAAMKRGANVRAASYKMRG